MTALPMANSKDILFEDQPSAIVNNWFTGKIVRTRIILQLFRITSNEFGHLKAFKILSQLRAKYQSSFSEPMYAKIARVEGKYYWRINTPPFPSKALERIQENEIKRLDPNNSEHHLRTLLLAITRKCPMNCEHCYEWNNLNNTEALSIDDLNQIIRKYQEYGTCQIFFGGGEPMVRYNAILTMLEQASPDTQFWMYTSGFHLTDAKAQELKRYGMTGVIVSLDHFSPAEHDRFRGAAGAYHGAIRAALVVKKAGLASGLALCATNDFCTEENLAKYMDLAKKLGVVFVQMLEPKAAGRYTGKTVQLRPDKRTLLEKFTRQYNTTWRFRDYPIINYPENVIRKIGCLSGDRVIYINSNGMIQQCPFCDQTCGNSLCQSVETAIKKIRQLPCPDYQHAQF